MISIMSRMFMLWLISMMSYYDVNYDDVYDFHNDVNGDVYAEDVNSDDLS